MSKSNIQAFVKAQYAMLQENSAKDRLPYVVGKIEDGVMYNLKGDSICEYDGEDVVFVKEEDLGLSRFTSSRLKAYQTDVNAYFGDEAVEEAEVVESQEPDDVIVDDGAVLKMIKKAVKKGKIKKAMKLAKKLGDKELRKETIKGLEDA